MILEILTFLALRNQQTKRCAIGFQGSNNTLYKFHNLSKKHVLNPPDNFHPFLILSKDVVTDIPTELPCDCNDERLSTHGLPCRVDCAIRYFYYNLTEPWFYLGGDDGWVNFNAFEHILDALESNYDPYTTKIFAGNLQQMHNVSFPHGGPGWLASRYFIQSFLESKISIEDTSNRDESYITDDIAMGLVLRESYSQLRFWANPWSLVALPHPNWLKIFKRRSWDDLNECSPDIERVSVRDVMIVHVTPYNPDWVALLDIFPETPAFVKVQTTKFVVSDFCKCTSKWCDLRITSQSIRKRFRPEQ
ncbi:hypothetical protein TVAG_081740 [Trichomonas vaginalis G3]|uniref:Hexosyltransferase n=1 Tax=Trichomonas vaginalis (strain ATCC PRA-98 / G3) TaxID=412133 RepID=A2E6W6_TRIV3|nr:hypothetical protein TVAGG3_0493010 [Trichomonas vaginalis G3]EAY11602.1 hypothetical protein TVAG_081740 [Trichomonas vaginalis G3]KAI5516515.1 hypothetical protein TVAGG3_0493010 [Trichomonas vaginalis G3]|eukprot:XP_001323825.1 hypothetical protein [Trichomonas vaginalis G3]